MKLIPDTQLLTILVKENKEELVDTRVVCPDINKNIGSYIKDDGEEAFHASHFVRKSVAEKLNIAQNSLPKGHTLMLRCGYRLPKLQIKLYNKKYKTFQKENLDWDEKTLKIETGKCVAPIELASHCAGAAIDVIIVDSKNKKLDMGTPLPSFGKDSYTDSLNISKEARKNRDMLIAVMTQAGFINFPTEWWHWSYGDTYWAAELKKEYALYGSIDKN